MRRSRSFASKTVFDACSGFLRTACVSVASGCVSAFSAGTSLPIAASSTAADGTGAIYNEIRRPAIFEETVARVAYMKQYRDKKGLTLPLLRVQSIMSAVESSPEEFKSAWAGVVDRMNIIADESRDFAEKGLQFDRYFVCAKPWQRMSIAYDGRVHQCISDYAAKNVLGDVNTSTLHEIWHLSLIHI
mgnify:CR=1 FL=1